MTSGKRPDAHIPVLDGVRAVAVMLVFFAHAGLDHLVPGGFGVTVFFFLSGFLITTLLRREFETTGTISLKNFYLRRIFRIFPPMYLVLALILLLLAFGVVDGEVSFGAVIAQLLHFTNYWVIFADGEGLVPGTGVYWSLAVEEHFYLLFPLLLLCLLGRVNHRSLAIILLLTCAIVLAWRCYLIFELKQSWHYTYHASETRIDSILFGCVLALWGNPVYPDDRRLPTAVAIISFILGIAALLFSLLYRDPEFQETLRYTMQGLALFPVFYCAVKYHNCILFRWLDWPPVRALGLISFTFYLSHILFLDLANQITPSPWIKGSLAFTMTVLFGTAMYHLVELRFAALRRGLHATAKNERAGTDRNKGLAEASG